MEQNVQPRELRRPKLYLSSYISNNIHVRNPFMTALWAAFFPGCGHIMLCKYFQGGMLFIWEVWVNTKSNINEAIVDSFTGQFQKAVQTVDIRWLLLYVGVYTYSIWDSYRVTVAINRFAVIADHERTQLQPFMLSALENNFLEKINPWIGAFFSWLTPGLGHLYSGILPSGFYLLIWFIVTSYYSHFLQAIHYTFIGDFAHATSVLRPEWVLFLPSIYGFSICAAFYRILEYNTLFAAEQANFFEREYQDPSFELGV